MKKPNRVALRGQPCRNPMEGVWLPPMTPLTLMDSRHSSYKDCMAPSMVLCTPSRRRRSHSSCQCTRSYADLRVHKAEIQWRLEASVLVNDVLQHRCLMDGAVLWPVACLSGRSEALLLCVLDQALNQDASIQPTERFTHCNWSVVSCVCSITPLKDLA